MFYCLSLMLFTLFAVTASGQPILGNVENVVPDLSTTDAAEGQRAGGGGGGGFPTDISSLQSGFGPLMNTMKDGKLVIGGFSFMVIPNPDPSQLQSLAGGGGVPFMGGLPGAG